MSSGTRPSGPGTWSPASVRDSVESKAIRSTGNAPSAPAAGMATSRARSESRAGAETVRSATAASMAGASAASASTVRSVAARVAGSTEPLARSVTASLRSESSMAPPVASAKVVSRSRRGPRSRPSSMPVPATKRWNGVVGMDSACTLPWMAARSKIGSPVALSSRSKRSFAVMALSGWSSKLAATRTSASTAPVRSLPLTETVASLTRIPKPPARNAASLALIDAVIGVPAKCSAPAASKIPGAARSTSSDPAVPCSSVRAVNFAVVSPPAATWAEPLKSRTAA